MKIFFNNIVVSLLVVIILGIVSIRFPTPSFRQYAALFAVLLIFYTLFLPMIYNFKSYIVRAKRRFFPSIAILNGNIQTPVGEFPCERSFISITPGMWMLNLKNILRSSFLRKMNFNIEFISLKKIDESYSMIINPFGDNFPEENTLLLTSFYKICNYVKDGGFFVCTGGAFFAHQNTRSSEKAEPVIVKMQINGQSLTDTLLFKELGILTSGDGSANEKNKVEIWQEKKDKEYLGNILNNVSFVKRFRAVVPTESRDFIPIAREKNGETFPVVAIPYGRGFFLHFGLLIESEDSEEFRVIANVIDNLIKRKFKIF